MNRVMPIFAGIVTYNPDIQRLDENLMAIASQVDEVCVFDNGSRNADSVRKLVESRGGVLLESDTNQGIAAALNGLFRWAEGRCSFLLTLDQDSVCAPGLVRRLSERATAPDVAVVCPHIVYRDNEQFQRPLELEDEMPEWCITSGSLTNVDAWRCIGGFDEWLFIDSVDYDFCVRLRSAGYTVRRVNDVALLHELGELRCRRLLGRTVFVTNHGPRRRYYQVRNRIYLQAKLGTSFASCATKTAIDFGKVVVYESKKGPKLSAMIQGVREGISARRMQGGQQGE